MRSLELASDLDDSDGRFGGVKIVPLGLLVVAVVDGRGDSGSSKVASTGRRLSSVKDFRSVFWRSKLLLEELSSRGISVERRNLAAKLILDDFFFGPVNSLVGAVVIISGGRGTGGVFSDCCLARRDS